MSEHYTHTPLKEQQEPVAAFLVTSPFHHQLLKCANYCCSIVKAKCEMVHPAIIPASTLCAANVESHVVINTLKNLSNMF